MTFKFGFPTLVLFRTCEFQKISTFCGTNSEINREMLYTHDQQAWFPNPRIAKPQNVEIGKFCMSMNLYYYCILTPTLNSTLILLLSLQLPLSHWTANDNFPYQPDCHSQMNKKMATKFLKSSIINDTVSRVLLRPPLCVFKWTILV